VGTPTLAQPGWQVFASEFQVPTRFFSVDPAGGHCTTVGTTRFSPGMDLRRNGTLVRINPATGQATTIGVLPDPATLMAFSPSDQRWQGLQKRNGPHIAGRSKQMPIQ
jgi:hypothetical protein